ncbi:class I SAM-dependent methyltransferase [Sorangium atrum]|uniref:Class I SAM-dependent methyltransferase n=1 Tax=Sorangium atrum TaxID=2995308 RepID=A0ABT5BWV8_9BACT|nr:class I SAM-dependent methyltransferase [Sorangium aterium]MDC0678649.1 class I SAM-dependent methyltransferase [Sorangium aterium]
MTPRLSLSELFPDIHPEWILAEDDDLIVVDKPAGLSTHAPEAERIDDMVTRLRAFLRGRGDAEAYLGIHQRLDRDTSGVLLFTRRREANAAIARQFEGRTVQKTYVAAVSGFGDRPPRGTLRHRLVPAPGGAMRALAETGGAREDRTAGREDRAARREDRTAGREDRTAKREERAAGREDRAASGVLAITRYRLLERRGDRALLELQPETGRTHQLRVQLAAIGLPIAGDPLYGGPEAPRLLLHAAELRLDHPATGAAASFRSQVPAAFEAWLAAAPADPYAGGVAAVERAMREAAERRYGIARAGDTTALRLVHGAGDGLPSVSVDLYGEHLVVSLFGAGEGEPGAPPRDLVLDAAHRLGAKGVYLKARPKHASVIVDARREEFAPRHASRGEDAPEEFTVLEHGLPFKVRLGDGLSTGIFLDQRENRRRVRELARGARVLNLFAYTGAFTVAAVAGGARESVTVDVSRGVVAWARDNLAAIGADPAAHVVVEADVFPWLKAAAQSDRRFDLVVLDPPSFATTKKSRFSAASDFGALAALAFRVLAPGGRLLACTNHRGIARARFRRHLHEAAREAGCDVVQMKDLPDPVDFPSEPGAESHLKSVLASVGAPSAKAAKAAPSAKAAKAAPFAKAGKAAPSAKAGKAAPFARAAKAAAARGARRGPAAPARTTRRGAR